MRRSSSVSWYNLKAEHQLVEFVDLLCVDCVVAHVDDIVGIPVELSHPDGQLELFPEQLNMSLYPLHLLKSQVSSSIEAFLI